MTPPSTPSSIVVFDSGSAIDVVRTRRDDDVKDDVGFNNAGFSAHQRSPKRFVVDDVGFRRARRVVEIGPDRAVAATTAR
jgi:hypothetical protein